MKADNPMMTGGGLEDDASAPLTASVSARTLAPNSEALTLDSVMELENEKYQEGFSNGLNQSTREQLLEGKEYGIQTGFQRALIIGYIQGLLQDWKSHLSDYRIRGFSLHLDQLDKFVQSINFSNDEDAVANYERLVQKARNKLRLVANLAGESWKVHDLDRLLLEVGGELRLRTDSEEMW